MKIVYLVIDYVPHQVLSIRHLIETQNAEVMAFHVGRFNKEVPLDIVDFETHQYQEYSKHALLKKINDFNPVAIVTAGWMIPEYVWIAKQVKKQNKIPIVAMSDTPWYGTIKQRINALISPWHLKKAFTHLWVAGIYQYDYARKLGFKNEQIIFNSLSADVDLFRKLDFELKRNDYPKNFLYIGNFRKIKGTENLISSWNKINNKKGWTLTVVGNGPLEKVLRVDNSIIVKDYMNQEDLLKEFEKSGCFILPSLRDQWGLVLHEAAAAGSPIICTKTCGASPHFVIDNFNGFKIENNSIEALEQAMIKIIDKTDEELLEFSRNSRTLSNSISPDISIANLMQVLTR